ncbi:MAG TPA: SDR family oxidoreductase [Clostridiaceae bacterium]|nr:SDR family oxidoreductase [Clostridiaceae bacterium]
MKNLFSLKDKVVLITGGIGYLGSAVVKGMVAHDATVMIADVLDKIPEGLFTEEELKSIGYVKADISDTNSIKEMFRYTKEVFKKIDVLINCAAYGAGYGKESIIATTPDEVFIKGLDGTIGTVFRCTREVIPYFEENGGGVIVNFASMYGMVSPDPSIYGNSGQNNPANYGAGKAATIQFTRYCAAHLADKNIRVNCVTPGPFPSPKKLPPEDFLQHLRNKTMLKRVGKAEEIVGAVILLASDASSFMTGANIVVDGGWTAW